MKKSYQNGLVQKRKQPLITKLVNQRHLILMALPAFIVVFLFNYLPMYGVVISFQDYRVLRGVSGSDWVGLSWFISFFRNPLAFRIIRNTVLVGTIEFAFLFPAPIILALLLNELKVKFYKRSIQTISYFPSFISVAIVIGLLRELASLNGSINDFVAFLGFQRIHFFARPEWFRTLYVGSSLWQSVGVGTIIYLAVLSNINSELYEAAYIDGANRWRRTIHITLPGIISTVIILFILRVGTIVTADFQKILLMYNPQVYSTADVIGTYVFREGIVGGRFSYTTAVGLLTNVVSFAVVFSTNIISRKVSGTSLW